MIRQERGSRRRIRNTLSTLGQKLDAAREFSSLNLATRVNLVVFVDLTLWGNPFACFFLVFFTETDLNIV